MPYLFKYIPTGKTFSLRRILQHFAVTTNQSKENMTILLRLLKKNKPIADYDSLSTTSKTLLAIDGNDVPTLKSQLNFSYLPGCDSDATQESSLGG